MEGLLGAVLDTIASHARIGSSYKPTGFSVGSRLGRNPTRPSDIPQASGVPLQFVAGLRRGHEIYDPLLLGPAQGSRRHCLLNGGDGIPGRQRRHWALRPVDARSWMGKHDKPVDPELGAAAQPWIGALEVVPQG